MKVVRQRFSARYLQGLRRHLGDGMTDGVAAAHRLGRAALGAGLVPLDLAIMHERAVLEISATNDYRAGSSDFLRRKGRFFIQALTPLDTAHHEARRSNWSLRQRNETLRNHAAALAAVNTALAGEVGRRKAGEARILLDREQYRKLYAESQVMQKRLRQLTRQIISAQEEERREISRELHDEVVQTLVGINVELAALGKGASLGLRALKKKIARTQRLVENSVNEVHRFARELRPAVLDDLGLIPALHAYSTSLAERKKLKIQMTAFGGVEALGSAKRTALFRVAQEALTNIARHAQATLVKMSIAKVPGGVRMEISDNGKAFEVAKVLNARNPKRIGLIGMQERVEMVGGHLDIRSKHGEGTTVSAEIPFKKGGARS